MEHLSQALAVDDCVAAGDSDSDNSDNAAAAAVADVAAQNAMANTIETLPPEVILHICSFSFNIPSLSI
ncbi:hypothetical protein EW145_g8554 [Phellinidium pouzarii]|uniref:Uncharacterized protein n=1 Tax=Phellinidium pouzarii TaxID=167371 RepID=A0A4V3X959_9AGAM|nr:hypothetical protein EW145_g8554 [Phellinidium pouzarii]